MSAQEENETRIGADIRGRDGHRVLVRGRDGVRVADAAQHRRGPPAHDAGVGRVAVRRVLRHARPGIVERPVHAAAGPAPAVPRRAGVRRVSR